MVRTPISSLESSVARNEQLIRQHKILQILERRRYGATLEDLRDSVVEELGLSSLHVRSIRRDLQNLRHRARVLHYFAHICFMISSSHCWQN